MPDNILITGAGKGLGLFLAQEYLKNGATVFALNHRPSKEVDKHAALHSPRLKVIICDVSDEKQVRMAAGTVAGFADTIDLLINNAAVYLEKPFTEKNEFDAETAKQTFNVNAIGPLLVVKHFFTLITSKPGNTVVNISSEAGSIGTCWREREYGYCMSKAALNMQSAIFQNRVREFGVKVLSVHPGWLRTEMGGPEADLDPAVIAAELVHTIKANRSLDGPAFIDHTGKKMEW